MDMLTRQHASASVRELENIDFEKDPELSRTMHEASEVGRCAPPPVSGSRSAIRLATTPCPAMPLPRRATPRRATPYHAAPRPPICTVLRRLPQTSLGLVPS